MSLTYFKKSELVSLALVTEEHIDVCVTLLNDQDDTAPFLRRTFPMTHDMEKKWIEDLYKAPHPMNLPFFVVALDQGEPKVVGMMGLHGINYVEGTATTGTMLLSEARGKGYGTEAKLLLLEYAFGALHLRIVASHIYEYNAASLRVQEKAGYREVARLPKWRQKGGKFYDEVIMQITREEWFELHPS